MRFLAAGVLALALSTVGGSERGRVMAADPDAGAGVGSIERFRGRVIPLRNGPNSVDLTGDGVADLIVVGWQENFNAHGAQTFQVLVRHEPDAFLTEGRWEVVGIERGPIAPGHVLLDVPHTGEDYVTSVVFATEVDAGRESTVLYVAARDLSGATAIPDPTPVLFEKYRLVPNARREAGWTPWYFAPVARAMASHRYCHAGIALVLELGFPAALAAPHEGDSEALARAGCRS